MALKCRTELFLFESAYVADVFRTADRPPAGRAGGAQRRRPGEFEPITPESEAADLVFVGELRPVKAVDVLIDAGACSSMRAGHVKSTIVGEGPLGHELKSLAKWLGVDVGYALSAIEPAREAFAMGRMLVMPSRTKSLPYMLLEAAAGGMPILATQVGGIPEIFGPLRPASVTANDPAGLARRSRARIDAPAAITRRRERVHARLRAEFSTRSHGRRRACRLSRSAGAAQTFPSA